MVIDSLVLALAMRGPLAEQPQSSVYSPPSYAVIVQYVPPVENRLLFELRDPLPIDRTERFELKQPVGYRTARRR